MPRRIAMYPTNRALRSNVRRRRIAAIAYPVAISDGTGVATKNADHIRLLTIDRSSGADGRGVAYESVGAVARSSASMECSSSA
jgi:hypothetical protein